jgi:hypothetical protein
MERVKKHVLSNPHLRAFFLGQSIEELPSLSFLDTIQVPFNDLKIRNLLQKEIDRVFFQNFLDGNKEYSFETFRNLFLESVRGIPSATTVATTFLTPIIDLQVQPDYLKKVVTGYSCHQFDSSLFEKALGKELRPKEFNLPNDVDSPDFSIEVVESFNNILRELGDQSISQSDRLLSLELELKEFDFPNDVDSLDSSIEVVEIFNNIPREVDNLSVSQVDQPFSPDFLLVSDL